VEVGFMSVFALVEGRIGGVVGKTSQAMLDFIVRFDQGDYPELMERELVAV
jgi:hypothetical protein